MKIRGIRNPELCGSSSRLIRSATGFDLNGHYSHLLNLPTDKSIGESGVPKDSVTSNDGYQLLGTPNYPGVVLDKDEREVVNSLTFMAASIALQSANDPDHLTTAPEPVVLHNLVRDGRRILRFHEGSLLDCAKDEPFVGRVRPPLVAAAVYNELVRSTTGDGHSLSFYMTMLKKAQPALEEGETAEDRRFANSTSKAERGKFIVGSLAKGAIALYMGYSAFTGYMTSSALAREGTPIIAKLEADKSAIEAGLGSNEVKLMNTILSGAEPRELLGMKLDGIEEAQVAAKRTFAIYTAETKIRNRSSRSAWLPQIAFANIFGWNLLLVTNKRDKSLSRGAKKSV